MTTYVSESMEETEDESRLFAENLNLIADKMLENGGFIEGLSVHYFIKEAANHIKCLQDELNELSKLHHAADNNFMPVWAIGVN